MQGSVRTATVDEGQLSGWVAMHFGHQEGCASSGLHQVIHPSLAGRGSGKADAAGEYQATLPTALSNVCKRVWLNVSTLGKGKSALKRASSLQKRNASFRVTKDIVNCKSIGGFTYPI